MNFDDAMKSCQRRRLDVNNHSSKRTAASAPYRHKKGHRIYGMHPIGSAEQIALRDFIVYKRNNGAYRPRHNSTHGLLQAHSVVPFEDRALVEQ